MEKKITVIIPVYNDRGPLRECLDSVFGLSYGNFNVIVVDDCSGDDSISIAKQYPCKTISLPKRRGPGFARNRGFSLADGEIVAFLDSDCVVPKDWLSKINSSLTDDIAGIGGPYLPSRESSCFDRLFAASLDFKNIFYNRPVRVMSFAGGNCAFWRSILMRGRQKKELVYCYGLAGGEDTIMCCEVGTYGELIYDPDIYVIHKKEYSFSRAIKKAVTMGYTGAIVMRVCGTLLKREAYRVKKSVIYFFSLCLFVSIFLLPLLGPRYLYFFLATNLLLEMPIIARAYRRFSLKAHIIFLPIAVFITDIMHLFGWIKRLSALLKDSIETGIWHIKLIASIFIPTALSKVFFFITNKCNANCYFCFNKNGNQMRHGGSDLSLGEIEKITAKIGFLPFLTITGGEPFLRDDLLDICELFYYNCDTRFISIVTNGIRSSAIIATVEELLIDCRHLKLTVIVALDDLDGSHDLIKRVSGCYEQAENTLKNLSNLKLRFPRLAIGINTMVLKENTGHLDTILDYFTIHYHCDRYALNLLREPPGTSNESSLISLGEYARLMKVINGKSGYGSSLLKQRINRELWEYCFKKSLEEFRLRRAVSPCLAGQKFIVIGNNGSIYGCELRPEGLGNIRASAYNLRNIIKDKSAENFRKDVKVQGCYCQWPCAAVCNAILTPPAYGGILKRLIFH